LLKDIDSIKSKEIDALLLEHKSFLNLMGDVASCCISESGWARARSYLSPSTKFDVSEPCMMVPNLFVNVEIKLHNVIIYKERRLIKLYVEYLFPDYEAAGCFEFLIRGASLNLKQVIDTPSVNHEMIRGVDDPNKVFGTISISIQENLTTTDNIYMRVRDTLKALEINI